jgi:hypothetical protein
VARNQVEVGVRNGSEEQRFARFRFRDLDRSVGPKRTPIGGSARGY